MARYGSWEDRPREAREGGRDPDRWRGEGTREWRDEDRWRAAERDEDRRRALERDELERDWRREWERGGREPTYGSAPGRGEGMSHGGTGEYASAGYRGAPYDPYPGARSQEGWRGYGEGERRSRGWRGEGRPEIDPPWVERGPEARGREESRGLVEWEDRGPLKWLGDRVRGAPGRPRGPKGYVRSDERIHDEVCERIARSGMDADEVEVKVEKREVTLTGTVGSRAEKWRLEELADDVYGVEEVHNQLRISRAERGLGTAGRTDEDAIEGRGLRH